ncbi:MAG: hypothetical protein R3F37_08605 [Candidatus Competibacteraceae bacterium]
MSGNWRVSAKRRAVGHCRDCHEFLLNAIDADRIEETARNLNDDREPTETQREQARIA